MNAIGFELDILCYTDMEGIPSLLWRGVSFLICINTLTVIYLACLAI